MKFNLLLSVFCLFFLLACDDEDPATPEVSAGKVVKEELTKSLTNEGDLTSFVAAFNELDLKAEDVAEGITVFAPADQGSSGGRISEGPSGGLTPEVLKGHIVKTLIDAAHLKNGDTLVALNGKLLIVRVDGDEIRVNGVLITSKDVASASKYIVHKVAELLGESVETNDPATLTVVVKNSMTWTPTSPDLDAEPGAVVRLYESRADFANGVVARTAETGVDGKAVFDDLEAGKTYYVVADKEQISSTFYLTQGSDLYFTFATDGVFQSQQDVFNSAAQGNAAPGNVRFKDMNGDGSISMDDQVAAPYHEANVASGGNEFEILIGYPNNDVMGVTDGVDALETVEQARGALIHFHTILAQVDGMLSDDAECGTETKWCPVDNFTFESTNADFLQIWSSGYGAINPLNLLVRDLPKLDFEGKLAVEGEARVLRAYVYLQLSTYFGGVPIQEGLELAEESRTDRDEVLTFVKNELLSATDLLPKVPTGGSMSSDVPRALLARVASLQEDWEEASSYALDVIQSANYALQYTTEAVFADASNSEIILKFSDVVPGTFGAYFHNRTFCPAVRLAEMYLIGAEAENELGNIESAKDFIEQIRDRAGLAPSSALTQEAFRAELRATWATEMSREGFRFANLLRWGIAYETLEPKGFNPNIHTLLPIPQYLIDRYPSLTQNPGY